MYNYKTADLWGKALKEGVEECPYCGSRDIVRHGEQLKCKHCAGTFEKGGVKHEDQNKRNKRHGNNKGNEGNTDKQ